MSRFQETAVRSELQSVGRTNDDLLHGEEAAAQRWQTRMPWAWLIVGLVVVAGFIAALMVLGPQARWSTTPRESPTFSTPMRHG